MRNLILAFLLAVGVAHADDSACLKITDYGAHCDNDTDDKVAWQSVVATALAQGGRCIQFPKGTCYISDGATWVAGTGTADQQMLIRGMGTSSRVRFRNIAGAWLVAGNFTELRIADLTFVGTPGGGIDAAALLVALSGRRVALDGVNVYGMSVGAHPLIESAADVTEVHRCQFLGVAAAGGGSIIHPASSLLVEDSSFIDFGNLDGAIVAKGTPSYWIYVTATTTADYIGQSGTVTIAVRRSRFDEGASQSIYLAPLLPGLRYQRVLLEDLAIYAPATTGAHAVWVNNAENVEISRCQINARSLEGRDVELVDAGDVRIWHSRVGQVAAGAGRIYVDAATRSAWRYKTAVSSWECHATACKVE